MLEIEGQHGMFVWFDPFRELLELRDLTGDERSVTLDKLSSVSALDEDEDPCALDGSDPAKPVHQQLTLEGV